MSKSQVIDNELEEELVPLKTTVGMNVLRAVFKLSTGLTVSLWQVHCRGRVRGLILWSTGPASNQVRSFAPFVTYNNAIEVFDAMCLDEEGSHCNTYTVNSPPLVVNHDLYVAYHEIDFGPSFASLLDEAPLEPGAF